MSLFDQFKKNKQVPQYLDIELPISVKLEGLKNEKTENLVFIPHLQKSLTVLVPNDVEVGNSLALRGCGLYDSKSNQKGDLFLIIDSIDCVDITINKVIAATERNNKVKVDLPHLGKAIYVDIPQSIKEQTTCILRLRGLGLISPEGKSGDLFLCISDCDDSAISNSLDLCETYKRLDSLIGLSEIKHDVRNMANLAKVQIERNQKGYKPVPFSMHCVFTGNPGTGKTTVARILASIYKDIGVLSKGQLVEVDRSDLVSQYIGETAIKTQQKIDEALGGVLFIDEAYTLVKDGQDHGQEAIDTILKAMEDYRNDFVVIVAGYDGLIQRFIESNPGLKSRFNKYFHFPDYSADELIQIFYLLCDQYGYNLTGRAESVMQMKIRHLEATKSSTFANAREIRNLFESIITNQASRLVNTCTPDMTLLTEDDFF